MALTQSGVQLVDNIRKLADAKGTSALARHPTADVYDYLNRALGSLQRKLNMAIPDQRFLASSTFAIGSSVSTYNLPADFHHLLSIDLTYNGTKRWITSYELNERPGMTSPSATSLGDPFLYRLRGSVIEILPTPTSPGSCTLWYVPSPQQFATDGSQSAALWDTIDRLDEYLIAYAARFIATRDRKTDLLAICDSMCSKLESEIQLTSRNRDKNAPARIIDDSISNRFGRRR